MINSKLGGLLNVLLFIFNTACTWLIVSSAFSEENNLLFYGSTFFVTYEGSFIGFLPLMVTIAYGFALIVCSNLLVIVVARVLKLGLISNGVYFAFKMQGVFAKDSFEDNDA
ncbi:hypothetical protein [Pseudoalteromonas spongiae]|uniref:hypothetical protein n=1 Tax=Pseudoalteromonas spongiae TaxID=298657 RepID=UPI000C2D0184|nr:hypothetical protein [Pseudoalteromonas spongiae]